MLSGGTNTCNVNWFRNSARSSLSFILSWPLITQKGICQIFTQPNPTQLYNSCSELFQQHQWTLCHACKTHEDLSLLSLVHGSLEIISSCQAEGWRCLRRITDLGEEQPPTLLLSCAIILPFAMLHMKYIDSEESFPMSYKFYR